MGQGLSHFTSPRLYLATEKRIHHGMTVVVNGKLLVRMDKRKVRRFVSIVGRLSALAVVGSAVWAWFSGSPWSPTRRKDFLRLQHVLDAKPGERMVELGCGDGRVSVAIARASGARVTGVELSLPLVLAAKLRVLRSGLQRQVKIRWGNFYRVQLRHADAVYLYVTPRTLFRLGATILAQLPSHARVISYRYPIPGFQPTRVDQPTKTAVPIYEYRIRPNARQVAFEI